MSSEGIFVVWAHFQIPPVGNGVERAIRGYSHRERLSCVYAVLRRRAEVDGADELWTRQHGPSFLLHKLVEK
jgi:hypothetical protein